MKKKIIAAHFHIPKLYQQAEVLNESMYEMAKSTRHLVTQEYRSRTMTAITSCALYCGSINQPKYMFYPSTLR